MRCAAFLMASVLAAATVVPARADDGTQDEAFLLTLQNYRIHMSRDEAFALGASLCVVMDEGTNLESVGLQLIKMHPDWTLDDAGHFAGAAIQRYCPSHMPA